MLAAFERSFHQSCGEQDCARAEAMGSNVIAAARTVALNRTAMRFTTAMGQPRDCQVSTYPQSAPTQMIHVSVVPDNCVAGSPPTILSKFLGPLFRPRWVNRCVSIKPPDRPLSVVAPIGDKISALWTYQGKLALLRNRGVQPCKMMPIPGYRSPSGPLEQGETDRRQTTAAAEACLGDPDQAPDRATNPRSGVVQSGHRQQVAGL